MSDKFGDEELEQERGVDWYDGLSLIGRFDWADKFVRPTAHNPLREITVSIVSLAKLL